MGERERVSEWMCVKWGRENVSEWMCVCRCAEMLCFCVRACA